MFNKWEDNDETCAAIDKAAKKLNHLSA